MKALIASSFYAEFELCETESLEDLTTYTKNMVNGIESEPPKGYKVLGSQDTMTATDAIAQAEATIWTEYLQP